ncbi:MAG: hypothetical protein ABIQ93_06485 [Saprospiraceae bacterium]
MKPLIILIFFWLFLGASAYLLWNTLSLNYPIGYKTNTFVYLGFITLSIIYLNDLGYLKKSLGAALSCSFVFYLVFMITGGFILITVFDAFDFDDKTIFLNDQFRIVETSDVIRSGGQSYIAVLERDGRSEHGIYWSGMNHWEKSRIITENGRVGLLHRNETDNGWDTIWIDQKPFLIPPAPHY